MAYGAVIVGGIQASIGIIQLLLYKMKTPEQKAAHHAKIDVRTIVQSMAVVAGADGEIDDSEVETIREVCRKLIGSEIDEKSISQISRSIARNEESVDDWLAKVVAQMTPRRCQDSTQSVCFGCDR